MENINQVLELLGINEIQNGEMVMHVKGHWHLRDHTYIELSHKFWWVHWQGWRLATIFFLNDGVERINEMAQPYDNDKEDDMQYFMEAR